MRKLLLGLGLIFGTLAFGAVTEPDRALVERARNLLSNGGFESSTATWSATGGTVASVTAAANVGLGNAALSWDASAASQVLSNTAVTIPAGLYAANGLARCMFKTTATDYVLQAYNGSSVLASATIPASTQYQQYGVNFPFPSSGSVSLRVVSASDAAVIYMDDCYVGPAANLQSVNQAQFYGSYTYNATGSCSFNTTGTLTTWQDFASAGTCTGVAAGNAEAPTTTIPAIRLRNLPPGRYQFVVTGQLGQGGASQGYWMTSLTDGTNRTAPNGGFFAASGPHYPTYSYSAMYEYTTAQSDVTWKLQGYTVTVANGLYINSGATGTAQFKIEVYRFPSTSELAYRPDQVAWRVDANIYGTNPSLGTSAVTSYSEITDASLALAQNSGSIATQIACASGTASSGTTCTAANESIGIAFTAPTAGDVVACASFTSAISGTSLSGIVTFQLVETTNTSSAVVQSSNSRIENSSDAPAGVFGLETYPYRLCGVFSFSSSGQKTIRLERTQSAISGTGVNNLILADRAANLGDRDIHWEVYPITQSIPAPLLVGSVTSNSSGLERVERASIAFCNSSPCTVTRQSGSWLTGVTRSSLGQYLFNIRSGQFSDIPTCTIATGTSCSGVYCPSFNITPLSSTQVFVASVASNNSNFIDTQMELICMGPR